MRPNIARALTAALATAGAAGAVLLPTLTVALGEPKSPARAFALPAQAGEVVIAASRPAEPKPVALVHPTPGRAAPMPLRSAVAAPVPVRRVAPVARPPVAAPPVPDPVAVVSNPLPTPTAAPTATPTATPTAAPTAAPTATPSPTPAPSPTPQPAPVPQPQPAAPAPAPSALRTLASVAPVAEQPSETSSTKGKEKHKRKDKTHKEKPKPEKASKHDPIPAALPTAPVVVELAAPVEPAPVEEPLLHESGKHDEKHEDKAGHGGHGGDGKDHDKQK